MLWRFLFFISIVFSSFSTIAAQPQLIVQLVVDQLRGDLVNSMLDKMPDGGFKYLISHGLNYTNAHHIQALTVTCVGHAGIGTGSVPKFHGIVANDWYDSNLKHNVYCTGDKHSPEFLKVSTLADELVLAKKGQAFAVSAKDRAAIMLVGHAGQAFWFDKDRGRFTTSNYYSKTLPNWLQNWNINYNPKPITWELSQPREKYRFANAPRVAKDFASFGNTFPHKITKTPGSTDYFAELAMTPMLDELTEEIAEVILDKNKLGLHDGKTDYLAISFSMTDAIGHQFGPNSLESEDNLFRLDRTLAKLITAIDKKVGIKNTLIVLTADHGVTDSPPYLQSNHMPVNAPVNIDNLIVELNLAVKNTFKSKTNIINISWPYLYIDHKIAQQNKLSIIALKRFIINKLQQHDKIYEAFAINPTVAFPSPWTMRIDMMGFPQRSGDIYLVDAPYQTNEPLGNYSVSHGSPWDYDSYVPLIVSGMNFDANKITRAVHPTDIAATLAVLLNIKMPSGSIGEVLQEVLDKI